MTEKNHYHFIGVCGTAMGAVAAAMKSRGIMVTGSDQCVYPPMSTFLEESGVEIMEGYRAANVPEGAGVVVIGNAISRGNEEAEEVLNRKLLYQSLPEVLKEQFLRGKRNFVVTGTHGKTTTSSLITTLLHQAGEDPTAVIGGIVPCLGSNGHSGQGRLLVAEADESDGSLVKFQATLGLITNLELDHTDHYRGLDDLITTLQRFGNGCDRLLANHDDPILREHFRADAWWSVQTSDEVDFAALPLQLDGDRCHARFFESGKAVGEFTLPMPGLHNLSNATAALAACRMEGLSLERLMGGLAVLQTPGRRFDLRGTWQGRHIVDDYAHHPSEVRATLEMARLMVDSGRSPLPSPPRRLLAVFQPHRFSRTQEFLGEFALALQNCDALMLAPVYAAGEKPIEGVCSRTLADRVRALRPDLPVHVADTIDELVCLVRDGSQPEDLVLAMGAGDVNGLWSQLSRTPVAA